jgi:hypothetical protein
MIFKEQGTPIVASYLTYFIVGTGVSFLSSFFRRSRSWFDIVKNRGFARLLILLILLISRLFCGGWDPTRGEKIRGELKDQGLT